MIYAGAQVLFYALVAAASPLVLAATFLVIRSAKPRRRGIAFLSGFVIGTAIACVLGLILGRTFVERLDSHDTVKFVVTFLLGIVLLAVGMRARHATAPAQPRSSRASAILASLGNVGPAATFSMAGLLGFGGPKRLVLTFLAMASVSEASIRYIFDLTLVAMYVAVSTALVSVPVVARGHRGRARRGGPRARPDLARRSRDPAAGLAVAGARRRPGRGRVTPPAPVSPGDTVLDLRSGPAFGT